MELARSFGGTFGELIGEQRLAQIEAARGNYDAARARLERAFPIARESREPMVRAHATGRILATLAFTEFRAGRLDVATRYLARGLATQRVVGECAGCDVHLYPVAVLIYLSLGDITMAEDAARNADRTAGAFRSEAWIAIARYMQGLVAAAQGDVVAASQRMEEALSSFERMGQPYEIARVSHALAAIVEDEERAAALQQRAEQLAGELGGIALDSVPNTR